MHGEDTSNAAFKKSPVNQNLAANEQSGGIVLAATKSGSLLGSSFLAQQNHIGAVASAVAMLLRLP